MRIETFRYNVIPEEKHWQLKTLLETAWSNQEESDVHPKEMDAMCYVTKSCVTFKQKHILCSFQSG